MREFVIGEAHVPFAPELPLVTYENDTFGIIGHILTLLSQMDPGDSILISCTDDVEV